MVISSFRKHHEGGFAGKSKGKVYATHPLRPANARYLNRYCFFSLQKRSISPHPLIFPHLATTLRFYGKDSSMIARKLALLALLVVPLVAWGENPVPPPPAASPDRLKTVTYSVADLVVPIGGLDYPYEKREEEQSKTKEAWLMKKITSTVLPRTWSGSGGLGTIQYLPSVMVLVVKQTPEVHALVAELLTTMNHVQNAQISLELRWLESDDTTSARLADSVAAKKDGQVNLSDTQLFMFLEAVQGEKCKIVQGPRGTIISGQRCDFQINEIIDMKIGAMVAGNLRHIDIDLKGAVHNVKFKKAARLVDGDTLVLSSRKENGKRMLLLVTPRVIIDVDGSAMNCEQPQIETAERTRDAGVIQASANVPNNDGNPSEKGRPVKRLEIKMGVYEGDPLGSREAKTIRTLAEPTVMTIENESFASVSGGVIPLQMADGVHVIPVGVVIEGRLFNPKDGKWQMDLTASMSKTNQLAEDNLQLQSESTRTFTRVRAGDVTKIRIGQANGTNQRWVELRVTEVPDPSESAVGQPPRISPIPQQSSPVTPYIPASNWR